ncbi:MAG: aminotransferase class V-fold PLP-dependent enzyme [Microcoleaceae cyanobacterium]
MIAGIKESQHQINEESQFWQENIKPLFSAEALNFIIKNRFGDCLRYINLDNAATTTPLAEVTEYINEMLNAYGSVHRGSGQKSRISTQQYDASRDIIRQFVGASSRNYVIFTQNTTGAINQMADFWAKQPGKILVSDIEHSSNLLPWLNGNEIIQYRTQPDGTINLVEIEKILQQHQYKSPTEQIKLLTITGASTITGYKPPIHEIAALMHRYGGKIFADLCQLIQHERVNILPDDNPRHLDFIAFSGHKMYAPYGTGVLVGPKDFFDANYPGKMAGSHLSYLTKSLEVKRFYTENLDEIGTPNAVGAVAIARAIQVIEALGREQIAEYEQSLVQYTFHKLQQITGVILHISSHSLAHVIPFDLTGFDSALVAEILAQEYGIGVGSGAFYCYEYIRKLKNISAEQDQMIAQEVELGMTRNIPSIIRASFAIYNTFTDCDRFVQAISEIVANGVEHYLLDYCKDEKTGVWRVNENSPQLVYA